MKSPRARDAPWGCNSGMRSECGSGNHCLSPTGYRFQSSENAVILFPFNAFCPAKPFVCAKIGGCGRHDNPQLSQITPMLIHRFVVRVYHLGIADSGVHSVKSFVTSFAPPVHRLYLFLIVIGPGGLRPTPGGLYVRYPTLLFQDSSSVGKLNVLLVVTRQIHSQPLLCLSHLRQGLCSIRQAVHES